jgi:hypothetical protein
MHLNPIDYYSSIDALANLTAFTKQKMPIGRLNARIAQVVDMPQSGAPDDSSKMQPTKAIPAIIEPTKSNCDLAYIGFLYILIYFYLFLICLYLSKASN